MHLHLVERFYDIASDFNDSVSLIALMLIVTKRSEMDFVCLKGILCDLEFDTKIVDQVEDMALSIPSDDMGRLIRLIGPIDQLFVRERPREMPSVITAGRAKMKTKKKSKPRAVKLTGLFEGLM